MPIALILYDERLDVWEPGAHTGTFRGNQLALRRRRRSREIIQRDGILENVREHGAYATARLARARVANTTASARPAGSA